MSVLNSNLIVLNHSVELTTITSLANSNSIKTLKKVRVRGLRYTFTFTMRRSTHSYNTKT